MIKGFEIPHRPEPMDPGHWQGLPALGAGLIAGVVMMVVPHANPWGLSSFTPAILGRVIPSSWELPMSGVVTVQLAISVLYGIVISFAVMHLREFRAVFVGGLVGLGLYLINLAAVSLWVPALRGNEVSVIFTHAVFGLVAAAAYRGLLRRRVPAPTG